ncbi:362_t:CDS:10, partial [Diversispora eburnea]
PGISIDEIRPNAYTEETGLDPWIKSETSVFEKPEINSKLLDEITELRKENIKIKTENTELKQDLDEFKKELEFKKNRKFQEKCILIAQVLLGEKPVQGAQHRLHSTSWYKDVKKLEDVVNRDRKKRCICQDNGIFLLEKVTQSVNRRTLPEALIARHQAQLQEPVQLVQEPAQLQHHDASKSDDVLTKFRELWWIQGNIHPKAHWDEASDVDWEKYTERTDFFNVHGNWEWIDGNVCVYELPLGPHGTCSRAIERLISSKDPEMMLVSLGDSRTRVGGRGKEADESFVPFDKPEINSNGREGPNSHKPWPNLVIEVAFSETEDHLLNAVKDYWLYQGRAHDAIAVKLVRSDTIISKIKVWHFCTDDRTPMGDLVPVSEFEFETIDDNDQFLIEPQQYTINIRIECLFHGMPPTFQTPSSIPNPLT